MQKAGFRGIIIMKNKLEQKTTKEPLCREPFNPKFRQQNYCLFGNINKESAEKCPFFYARKSPLADGCNYLVK